MRIKVIKRDGTKVKYNPDTRVTSIKLMEVMLV